MRFDLDTLSQMLRDVLINFRLVEFYGDIGSKPEKDHLLSGDGMSRSGARLSIYYNPDRYSPRGFKITAASITGLMGFERVTVRIADTPREFYGVLLNEDVKNKLVVMDFQIHLEGPPVPVSYADSYLPLAEGRFYVTPFKDSNQPENGIVVIDSEGNTVAGSVLAGLPPALQAAQALKQFEPAEMETQSTVKMLWILDKEGIMTPAVNHQGNGMAVARFQERAYRIFHMNAGVFSTHAMEEMCNNDKEHRAAHQEIPGDSI